jgi:RNA polymerase sigma factor (sigma-70 family)
LDCHARNLLIEQALPRIQLIASTFSGRLPPGVDTGDLVNETVERIARHLDRGLPWSWARVEGAMQDFLRSYALSRRGAMPDELPSPAANPEELAIRSDRRRIVQRNAQSLTAREQAFLRLASSGVSGARIARELRVNDRRARAIRQSAVDRLKGDLGV